MNKKLNVEKQMRGNCVNLCGCFDMSVPSYVCAFQKSVQNVGLNNFPFSHAAACIKVAANTFHRYSSTWRSDCATPALHDVTLGRPQTKL